MDEDDYDDIHIERDKKRKRKNRDKDDDGTGDGIDESQRIAPKIKLAAAGAELSTSSSRPSDALNSKSKLKLKKVDPRIQTVFENCSKTNHRSLLVIIGDNGKYQIPNIHSFISRTQVKARPSVLWMYKEELSFSTHKKKRMRQVKKMIQRGLYDHERDDPFELFIASTKIRWAYYRESHKILGQTFGMCVLQDFEALTPNLLARTIETVEGGGSVVVLLKTMDSLRQLYSLVMDVHARFRTESNNIVTPRFNERFILSLAGCETCVVMDDELNILPISRYVREISPVSAEESQREEMRLEELSNLKKSLADTQPAGSLVSIAKTRDQAKAILTFIEAISEKSLRSTVILTAARGRGKSAALGVGLASAIAYGYSNIFVTAPSPENLGTVFEFLFKAFEALKYKEHIDYQVVRSSDPEHGNAVIRVNVFHEHRQTIQYVQPHESSALAQAELVAIDEAAAIPLPLVRKLMGKYLVFLSSTINGYEGTGRSLSLKLISELRSAVNTASSSSMAIQDGEAVEAESDWRTNPFMYKTRERKAMEAAKEKEEEDDDNEDKESDEDGKEKTDNDEASKTMKTTKSATQTLREIELEEPIRYGENDPVEKWLHKLLCLDATKMNLKLSKPAPHPSSCELFAVDRDTLFAFHKVSEAFLQRIMALFVSSHYKNSPNDLQLLSDNPSHRVFVLLETPSNSKKDQDKGGDSLPDILCVIQVALEGGIGNQSVKDNFDSGTRASGDLIAWTVAQQFQANQFAAMRGARVVRIATHPSATRMGYGKRALELLKKWYQLELSSLDESDDVYSQNNGFEQGFGGENDSNGKEQRSLKTEAIKPRKGLRPLLVPLYELRPPQLDYLGVSYGLTQQLFDFWSKCNYRPVYLRQTANEITGEYTCIMVNPTEGSNLATNADSGWLENFCSDFKSRFSSLVMSSFRDMPCTLALSILLAASPMSFPQLRLSERDLLTFFSSFDLERLYVFAKNLVDYHLVSDLVPQLVRLYLNGRLSSVDDKSNSETSLSNIPLVQQAILIGRGLQSKSIEDLSFEYNMPTHQVTTQFNKTIKKLISELKKIQEEEAEREVDSNETMKSAKKKQARLRLGDAVSNIAMDQDSKADRNKPELSEEEIKLRNEAISKLDLSEYEIQGDDEDWQEILENDGSTPKQPKVVSIKTTKASKISHGNESAKKKQKKDRDNANPSGDSVFYDPKNRMNKQIKKKL